MIFFFPYPSFGLAVVGDKETACTAFWRSFVRLDGLPGWEGLGMARLVTLAG
jgi:hypothetical protein